MVMKLRLIKKDDISRLAAVYARAFNKADVDVNWTQKTATKLINYWYKQSPDLFFVAMADNEIIDIDKEF